MVLEKTDEVEFKQSDSKIIAIESLHQDFLSHCEKNDLPSMFRSKITLKGTLRKMNLDRRDHEKARTDIAQIEKALETYRFQHYSYPTTDQGIDALIEAPEGIKNKNLYPRDGYISSIPIDPWGNDYLYLFPGQFSKFDVYSLGADGRPGGDGEDADIGNWDEK